MTMMMTLYRCLQGLYLERERGGRRSGWGNVYDEKRGYMEKQNILLQCVVKEREVVIGAGLWSASLGLSLQPKQPLARYSVWFLPDLNPQLGFSASSSISEWSDGV